MKELKELQKRIRNGDVKFEIADIDSVTLLEIEVDAVLQALGQEEALVTDESQISDFYSFLETDEIEVELERLRAELGVEIYDEFELIITIAQRIKDKNKK